MSQELQEMEEVNYRHGYNAIKHEIPGKSCNSKYSIKKLLQCVGLVRLYDTKIKFSKK